MSDRNNTPRRANLFISIEAGSLWGMVHRTTPEPEPEPEPNTLPDYLDSYLFPPDDIRATVLSPIVKVQGEIIQPPKVKLNIQYRLKITFEEYASNYNAVKALMEVRSRSVNCMSGIPEDGRCTLMIEDEENPLFVVPLMCDVEEEYFVVDLIHFDR
jgi:hypothetical protein